MTHIAARGRRRTRIGVAVVVAAVLSVLPQLADVSPASAAGTGFSMTTYGAMVVDPATGRIFVSGDDKVEAFSPSGVSLGSVPDISGARGLAFAAGHLWATETDTAAIAKIDTLTLAKVGEYSTGAPVRASLAEIGGNLWFGVDGQASSRQALMELVPTTGELTAHGTVRPGIIEAVPGSTDQLLVSSVGINPYSVYLYDIAGPSAVELAEGPSGGGSNLRNIAVTEVGTFVAAAGWPYRFDEVSIEGDDSVIQPTGVVYPATSYPNGIAYSPERGGVVAGTTQSSNQLFVARRGVPISSHVVSLGSSTIPDAVALSPSADRAYALVAGAAGELSLTVTALTPTITGTSSATVTSGRPTPITITGVGLGAVTSIELAGSPVDFVHDGSTRLVLDVRTSLPPSLSVTLELSSPWGDLALPFATEANAQGTVSGTVSRSLVPVQGATVGLTGDFGYWRTTSTDATGGYAFAGVPAGDHYDIQITSGSTTHTFKDQALTDAGAWEYSVDLEDAPPTSLERRRLALPPGEVRRTVTDPGTGLTFTSVGDVIVVADASGRFVRQIADQWSVDDLQVVGNRLYAMLRRAGTVSVIDTSSLEVVDGVAVKRLNTGSFAVVGNRLFLADGDNQWTHLAAVDLTTGTVARQQGTNYTPLLTSIDGAPSRFLSWEEGISSSSVVHWDASAPELAKVATAPSRTFGYDPGDFVAHSASNRVWNSSGMELVLSTMQPSGVVYPAEGSNRAVARSSGHGGVLVFGRKVTRQGTTIQTHELPLAPNARSVSIDRAGNRTFAASDGALVAADLAPIVNSLSPNPLPTTPTGVSVAGEGLGGTTTVRVDGSPVSFALASSDRLNVNIPTLAQGDHLLTVETPWGTSGPRRFAVGENTGPWSPFSSWSTFVGRQFQDVTASAPDAATRNSWVNALGSGDVPKGDLIEFLRTSDDNLVRVDPTARLYRALLGRSPDPSGMRYWVARRRTGSWSLVRMANFFAGSAEFIETYGAMTNRQFVLRIYNDVLGRPADPSGVDFWTGQLDTGRRSRGSVMVGFSESNEYRELQAENTDAAMAYLFLLGRMPTPPELDDWVTRQSGGTSLSTLSTEILDSAEYADHVVGP